MTKTIDTTQKLVSEALLTVFLYKNRTMVHNGSTYVAQCIANSKKLRSTKAAAETA
jgi:hypothetical protein